MNEVFYYSFRTAKSIVENMDEVTKARMYDQLFAMLEAYDEQNRKLEDAERREERLRKRYEALKKQLKSSKTTNDQRPTTND
jgi:hypothetical protein